MKKQNQTERCGHCGHAKSEHDPDCKWSRESTKGLRSIEFCHCPGFNLCECLTTGGDEIDNTVLMLFNHRPGCHLFKYDKNVFRENFRQMLEKLRPNRFIGNYCIGENALHGEACVNDIHSRGWPVHCTCPCHPKPGEWKPE